MPPKQFSKFKPWRKGKSTKNSSKNMSLKNRLRGQRRLLAKLTEKGENGDIVRARIQELEREVEASGVREREKKNSAKYHQVKFIERQKLTRLEKSIQRQLTQLHEQSASKRDKKQSQQISKLESQLKSIALDQLYIAFYPADVKYMSLFTNGMTRAVDDEKGQRRRRDVWRRIRENLSNDLEQEKMAVKNWVNFETAKKALLSMSPDTYPNAPSSAPNAKAVASVPKTKIDEAKTKNKKGINAKTARDDRFVLSREVEGMFHESTTGDDYEEKLEMEESEGSSDTDESSVSSDGSSDEADPLKGFKSKTCVDKDVEANSTDEEQASEQPKQVNHSSEGNSSSSSSDSSDSSDSESETAMHDDKLNSHNNQSEQHSEEEESESESEDDFFTTTNVSAAEVFAQAEKHQQKEHASKEHYYAQKKSDKSRGFSTQNQTKREFRNFQHRKKKSRIG